MSIILGKVRLVPKRKIVSWDGETIKLIRYIVDQQKPDNYGAAATTVVEIKKEMKLVPKRKLVGIEEITPYITNTLIKHIEQIVAPSINWAGGGNIFKTEIAITGTVSLASQGATKAETAITGTVELAEGAL